MRRQEQRETLDKVRTRCKKDASAIPPSEADPHVSTAPFDLRSRLRCSSTTRDIVLRL